jgi:hypothetical protein
MKCIYISAIAIAFFLTQVGCKQLQNSKKEQQEEQEKPKCAASFLPKTNLSLFFKDSNLKNKKFTVKVNNNMEYWYNVDSCQIYDYDPNRIYTTAFFDQYNLFQMNMSGTNIEVQLNEVDEQCNYIKTLFSQNYDLKETYITYINEPADSCYPSYPLLGHVKIEINDILD